jgi:hypothetical protein
MADGSESSEQDDVPGTPEPPPAATVARPIDLLIASGASAGEQRTPTHLDVRLPPRRAT